MDEFTVESQESGRTNGLPDAVESPLQKAAHRLPKTYLIGSLGFQAIANKIVVLEDEFQSGYECVCCHGSGKVVCPGCLGSGQSRVNAEVRCSECHGEKQTDCLECNGKGGLLVIPDDQQQRPSSGLVVTAGPDCVILKEGDQVLYSNFSGYTIDLDRAGTKVVLRIMRETEVFCIISGQVELRTLRHKQEISTL